MKHTTIITLAAVSLAIVTASSCRRAPLTDEGYGLMLEFEHTLDVRHEGSIAKPEKMYTIFYDIDSHKSSAGVFTEPDGGIVDVPAGNYDIIAHSFDSPATHVREDGHLHTVEAYVNDQEPSSNRFFQMIVQKVNEARSRAPEYGNEPLVNTPDHFFVASRSNENVPVMYEDSPIKTIKMYPATIVEPYYIQIGRVVSGAKYIESATVYVSGQQRSRLIGKGEHTGEASSISFPIYYDSENQWLSTVFRTFGAYPETENHVYLLVIDTFGRRLVWDWDVTDQFRDSERLGYRIIIDEDIVIPAPTVEGDGAGFLPVVTDWDNNHEQIEI